MRGRFPIAAAACLYGCAAAFSFQAAPAQLLREGHLEEALALYRQGVEKEPKSLAANMGAGTALDLLGRSGEARTYFEQAIKAAVKPAEQAQANRAMAISYGFSADCRGAEKYGRRAFDYFLALPDFYNAGEAADEVARLCIDAGDLNRAYDWYQRGYNAGIQEPDLSAARADLWSFRRAHARARIAVRQGKTEEARKLVAQARALLDKGKIPEQEVYFPYLTGYVAFYSGDYAEAVKDLQGALQNDPFILCLMGQAYEKLGERAKALECYRKAARTTAHNPPAAMAKPFATSRLQQSPN
ncbi:MAG: tetratricopeptide repeat protein [Acidobacteriota bacterium]